MQVYLMCRASHTTKVTTPTGVFWVINASDESLVWSQTFTRVEMFIDGEPGDFYGSQDSFYVSKLLLHAFSG